MRIIACRTGQLLRLILVRHGETERNSEGRLQGGMSDLPLNEKGREQARLLGLALRDDKIDAIYSSPLKRALSTAGAICAHHHLRVQTTPALTELNMGLIDGMDRAQIMEDHADFWRRWQAADYTLALPGGESILEVQQRAWEAVEDIHVRHSRGSVAVIGHGIALQTIIASALKAPLSSLQQFRLTVGSISILHMTDNGNSLVKLNATAHLALSNGQG